MILPHSKLSLKKEGLKKNLFVKKFIKIILYSKDQIQINLYYSEDLGALKNSVFPLRDGRGGSKKEKGTSVSTSESPQFELSKLAPQLKSEQTIPIIIPNTIHKCKKKNL